METEAPTPRAVPSLFKVVVYSVTSGSGHMSAVVSKKTQVANDLTALVGATRFADINFVLDGST